MSRRLGSNLVTFIVFALLLPAAADARTTSGAHQVTADVTSRVDPHIGFIPTNEMSKLPSFRVYVGHGEYVRGPWINAVFAGASMKESIAFMGKSTVIDGIWADRRLTRAERRKFVQVADIGRDADVLIVKAGHPACDGLTHAQVRSIVAGKTTKWSQVAAPASGSADSIRLIHTRFREQFIEPRFGANVKKYAGKPASDGGLEAAAADGSVAAITSWARARSRGGVCAVPINGVQPTNVTVSDLTFPGAYPMTFVTSKKKLRDRYKGALIRRYVKFFQSERARKLMRGTGLLIAGEKQQEPTPPPVSGGGPGPSHDSQGRPITPTRDDAGVASALIGERFDSQAAGSRWVFDPDGVFRLLDRPSPETCAPVNGRWTVLEGWRYAEYGGGIISRVQLQFDSGPRDVTIEVANETPGVGYIDGEQYARSRSLEGNCP
jgi:ABC-type phosphate transport system substrate-binding protein